MHEDSITGRKEGEKAGRFTPLRSLPGTSQPLPPELREALTAALAEMLVKDYQSNQGVTEPTVVEASLSHRESMGHKRPHFTQEMD